MTDGSIAWHELIVLMAFGRDGRTPSMRGVLHRIDTWEADPDADPQVPVVDHPTLGRLAVRESTARVMSRDGLLRVERLDGRVSFIYGAETRWLFGTDPPTAIDRRGSSFGWDGAELVGRVPASRWEGDDFTRLSGAIEADVCLGRPAWTFELQPPRHKPYPLQMTVDAETGLVLKTGNRDFGSVTEWTELEVGIDLPDDLFEYDGPTQPPEDHHAAHEREMERRRDWLREHGLDAIELPVRTELMPHEMGEDGAVYMSIDVKSHATLVRRPISTHPWQEAETVHYPQTYRWSDERWDWLLATDNALSASQLDELKNQLAGSS